MTRPQWVPARAEAPGLVLSLVIAGLAFAFIHVVPDRDMLSEVPVAAALGAVIVNTPLRRWLGFPGGTAAGTDRYAPGLRFVATWVVRLAIVLLGLKLRPRFFRVENVVTIAAIAAVSMPTTFLVTHVAGAWARLRRPLVDVLAGGTMICRASAVTAIGPVVEAELEECSIAMSTVLFFSMVAMASMYPLSLVLHLDPLHAGLWSGLAVNDLSSALAIGRMMDAHTDSSSVMSAMAKSARICLLAPSIIAFQFARARRGASRSGAPVLAMRVIASFPGFLVGYIALGVLRNLGDKLLPGSPAWHLVREIDNHVFDLAMVTVAASIGLQLDFRKLLGTGLRSVVVGGVGWTWTAALTVSMLLATSQGHAGRAVGVAVGAFTISGVLYAVAVPRARRREPDAVTPAPTSPEPRETAHELARARRRARRLAAAVAVLVVLGVSSAVAVPNPEKLPPPQPSLIAATPSGSKCPAGMAFVPGGTFQMGATDGFDPDEAPIRTITVESFCLDTNEVTVRAYWRCVSAGACTPVRDTADWPDLSWVEAAAWSKFCNGNRADRQDHPVNCVDWYQARAYCHAVGGRLPTEAEWEYAARGGDQQRKFSWGADDPDPTRANLCGGECPPLMLSVRKDWSGIYRASDGWPTTAPVGTFPAGAGRWGHLDMAGNVTEWVEDRYCPYDHPDCDNDERVVRGDGYLTSMVEKLRNARRNHDEPWHRSPDAGFRCARSP